METQNQINKKKNAYLVEPYSKHENVHTHVYNWIFRISENNNNNFVYISAELNRGLYDLKGIAKMYLKHILDTNLLLTEDERK